MVGMGIGFTPSPARAYHTYQERLLDDTAYSLRRREARLGLMQLSYGILDQLEVRTYTFPWILGSIFQEVAPNVALKSTFYDQRRLALAASVGFLTGTIKQADDTKVRYFLVPIGVAASVRINSVISLHSGSIFAVPRFSGDTQAGGSDIEGALVVSVLQLWETLEWRLSPVVAFTLFVRWLPYVSNGVLKGTIDVDENTDGTIEAEVSTEDLKNAWAVIPGFVFSWKRANLKLGLGYGDLFLPGIGLVVPGPFPRAGTPAPVLDFDIFVRF
jgi:hypothetical protein